MREFSNYVFDFYGTRVNVRTDEHKPALWRFMADFHGAHGCLFDPSDLRDAFWRFDAEEREAARRLKPLCKAHGGQLSPLFAGEKDVDPAGLEPATKRL